MNIHRKNGFYVSEPPNEVRSIGMESSRIDACIQQYYNQDFEGVFGHQSFGFKGEDFDFISELSGVRKVWFWDCKFKSVDGLYEASDLEECGVMEKRPGIDYSRFPKLKSLVVYWNPKDESIEATSAERFHLWHYNPKHKTFDGLKIPSSTEDFRMAWFNPSTFAEFPILPKAKRILLQCGRNVESVEPLLEVFPSAEHLVIESCKRIKDPEILVDHPTLKFTTINGKNLKNE